jgi:hypothetical protein
MDTLAPTFTNTEQGLTSEQRRVGMNGINRAATKAFYNELVWLCEDEPRISVKEADLDHPLGSGSLVLFVDGGSEYAYYTHVAWGQEEHLPVREWRGMVSLSIATDALYGEIFEMRNLVYDVFKDSKVQALMVINALKAHIEAGFTAERVDGNPRSWSNFGQ